MKTVDFKMKFLPMARAKLQLTLISPDWWEWTLVTEETRIVLGADTLRPMGPRALGLLSSGGKKVGDIDGREVFWVFSLSEKHHSLYAAIDGAERLLYLRDAEGRVVWQDRLTADHLKSWTSSLS